MLNPHTQSLIDRLQSAVGQESLAIRELLTLIATQQQTIDRQQTIIYELTDELDEQDGTEARRVA